MARAWVDIQSLNGQLERFFGAKKKDLGLFGSTVNQVFEAFVFAQVIAKYKGQPGWRVELVNPRRFGSSSQTSGVRLKFTTAGRPVNFTYARCISPSREAFQIRHQLRVATRHHRRGTVPPANICLDVAVTADANLDHFSPRDYLSNTMLKTFGEAKHMSAFAELVAGFVGLVHELQPERLRRVRVNGFTPSPHPAPFLFVSGHLWSTAEGLRKTLEQRKFDMDIYTQAQPMSSTPIP